MTTAATEVRPVKLGDIPGWMMRRLCWSEFADTVGDFGFRWGQHRAFDVLVALSRRCRSGQPLFFDHWGASVNSPEPERPWWGDDPSATVFVTEPYFTTMDDVWRDVSWLGDMLGVEFRVLGPEHSFHGRGTCRIEFQECTHDGYLCKGCKSRETMRDESRERKRRRRRGAFR